MHHPSWSLFWALFSAFLAAGPLCSAKAETTSASTPIGIEEIRLRMRYAVMPGKMIFRGTAPMTVRSANQAISLDVGEWKCETVDVRPARQRFHVFPKTFQPAEKQELAAYLEQWRGRGYDPQVETFGLAFKGKDGRILDNRVHWVSLARFDRESEADACINRLKQEQVWAWKRPETTAPGEAVFLVKSKGGDVIARMPGPIEIDCAEPVELNDVSSSFWKERKANRLLAAPLRLGVGPTGDIETYGMLSVETYLRGVAPAEMPASWPLEALKAQAVVARSEILASLAGKYRLEGFDFTALESCRAYWGVGGHHPATDKAIAETAGMVLVSKEKCVQAVFHSCCGGWTENNENIWSGPANHSLRGRSDLAAASSAAPSGQQLKAWLSEKPKAWCAADETGFRWKQRYSVKELSDIVNRRHRVGTIKNIQEGPRGVSGRLRSVTITGSAGTATVERELAIRQAFGGLPSAMFIITATPTSFVFTGGGRGHGVGMCQHGARGMALAGRDFAAIVMHYFSDVAIERMR